MLFQIGWIYGSVTEDTLTGFKMQQGAGNQSTACHHDLVSRVLHQSIFPIVLIRCSVGLLGQWKFCLVDIVLSGMVTMDD
jgi:hypothetical protein